MEGKTKCQDLYSRLKTEDPYEVRLCIILRKVSKRASEARREKMERRKKFKWDGERQRERVK